MELEMTFFFFFPFSNDQVRPFQGSIWNTSISCKLLASFFWLDLRPRILRKVYFVRFRPLLATWIRLSSLESPRFEILTRLIEMPASIWASPDFSSSFHWWAALGKGFRAGESVCLEDFPSFQSSRFRSSLQPQPSSPSHSSTSSWKPSKMDIHRLST